MLDCSKAFDVIRYDELFKALLDRNMCPLIMRLILNVYTNAKYRVKWNGVISKAFGISNGVKQGGVTSPFLFTIVMEALITKVQACNVGCHVGNRNASIFVFADDILLLCPTRASAQRLVNVCYDYAEDIGLKFNAGKCKVLIFGMDIYLDVELKIGNVSLKRVSEEYHVGHLMSTGTFFYRPSRYYYRLKY